jgi:hypothetical protein
VDDGEIGVGLPAETSDLSVEQIVQIDSKVHPASYRMYKEGYNLEVKWRRCEADFPPPPRAKNKNALHVYSSRRPHGVVLV